MKSEIENEEGKHGYSAAVSVLFTIGIAEDDSAEEGVPEEAESEEQLEDYDRFYTAEEHSEADKDSEPSIDFRALGLSEEHIPELIKLATDVDIYYSEDVPDDEFFAIVCAWRALAQLEATDAAIPLLRMLRTLNDDETEFDDWGVIELPKVLSIVGRDILPTMALELHNHTTPIFYRMALVDAIGGLSFHYEDLRQDCVAVFTNELSFFRPDQRVLNASIVLKLAEMKAVEALDTIRQVFALGIVAVDLFGDLEEAEIIMGVRTERETPTKHWIDEEARLDPHSHYNLIDSDDDDDGKERHETVVNTEPKIGRNDPCPCGSEKKYKKCCLKA